VRYTIIESPVGPLLLAKDEEGVRQIRFHEGDRFEVPVDWTRSDRALTDVVRQLDQYFNNKRTSFDIPLAPEGTSFQKSVWTALLDIPFGRTVSYQDIANRLGRPGSVRAVGAANGANPIPIIIPCHRVIGSDGSLTGYGGGLDNKRWLLDHEGIQVEGQMGLFGRT